MFSVKANILIDQNCHACLADFGLLTAISDPINFVASSSIGVHGSIRWMSPELLHPELYDLQDSRPTRESDSYALGMVIYEVLSGQIPFPQFKEVIVMLKVIQGEHPERPEGAEGVWFTDNLWETLVQCWAIQPGNRPGIEGVLECLGQVSNSWVPLPMDENMKEGGSDWEFELE